MKAIIKNIICFAYTNIKFIFIKIFHFNTFRYSVLSFCSPFSEIDIRHGKLIMSRNLKIRSNSHIRVRKNAKLSLGENFSMNYGCLVVAHDSISIGRDVILGPNVLIYDHDHDFSKKLIENKFTTAPVKIGNNVWIGANTVILKGTKIGDNVVIGASCVIKGKIEDNSVIVQKRETINLINRNQEHID